MQLPWPWHRRRRQQHHHRRLHTTTILAMQGMHDRPGDGMEVVVAVVTPAPTRACYARGMPTMHSRRNLNRHPKPSAPCKQHVIPDGTMLTCGGCNTRIHVCHSDRCCICHGSRKQRRCSLCVCALHVLVTPGCLLLWIMPPGGVCTVTSERQALAVLQAVGRYAGLLAAAFPDGLCMAIHYDDTTTILCALDVL
jgi:hypothetical protein